MLSVGQQINFSAGLYSLHQRQRIRADFTIGTPKVGKRVNSFDFLLEIKQLITMDIFS